MLGFVTFYQEKVKSPYGLHKQKPKKPLVETNGND